MGKKEETFKADLEQIKEFLSKRRKITDLATEAGVSSRLVYEALAVSSFEELTGDKLTVYEVAINMVARIKNLPEKASSVLNS